MSKQPISSIDEYKELLNNSVKSTSELNDVLLEFAERADATDQDTGKSWIEDDEVKELLEKFERLLERLAEILADQL